MFLLIFLYYSVIGIQSINILLICSQVSINIHFLIFKCFKICQFGNMNEISLIKVFELSTSLFHEIVDNIS